MTANIIDQYYILIMGHRLRGVEASYFIGQEQMLLEHYLKHQHLLTVYTPQQQLQKDYDSLKKRTEALNLEAVEKMQAKMEHFEKMSKIMSFSWASASSEEHRKLLKDMEKELKNGSPG